MAKALVLAEKPSVARDIARVLGAKKSSDGFIEGDRYVITWALGHLVTLADPDAYDDKYKAWRLEDLPMLPEKMKLVVIKQTSKQYRTVSKLMGRADIDRLIIATDAARPFQLFQTPPLRPISTTRPSPISPCPISESRLPQTHLTKPGPKGGS